MLGRRDVQGPLRPGRRLVPDPQVQHLGQRRDKPQRQVPVPVGESLFERHAEVVAVGQRALDPRLLVGALDAPRGPFSQFGDVRGMTTGERDVVTALPQALASVGAHRLQHPIAGAGTAGRRDHHRLVDEPGEQGEHLDVGCFRLGAHPVDGVEFGAAREHRHSRKQALFWSGQQPVGPVDGRGEALVPRLRGARAAHQELAVVEPLPELGGTHHPHPGRSELDRERQPVEAQADLRDGAADLPVRVEVRPGAAGPVDEQR
jgi:hypothetical protein